MLSLSLLLFGGSGGGGGGGGGGGSSQNFQVPQCYYYNTSEQTLSNLLAVLNQISGLDILEIPLLFCVKMTTE